MDYWDFLVAKGDLARTELCQILAPAEVELQPGEVLLEVERFALTANNITYGLAGDRLGYWSFFHAPDGWGRIPAWGFARVIRSRAADIAEGLRIFGYVPMSTHYATRLERRSGEILDTSSHRAALPPFYNLYAEAAEGALDDYLPLLRPLFMTSFLLDDFLAEAGDFGVQAVVLASASSKTALGLAWLLARRGVQVVGLTSERHRSFLEELGSFAQVESYGAIDSLSSGTPFVFIDFAGDPDVRSAVHNRFGSNLMHSAIVGSTHREARMRDTGAALPGLQPQFFFAPDQARKRAEQWGSAELNSRLEHALVEFIRSATWLQINTCQGADELSGAYTDVLAGRTSPAEGTIIKPS